MALAAVVHTHTHTVLEERGEEIALSDPKAQESVKETQRRNKRAAAKEIRASREPLFARRLDVKPLDLVTGRRQSIPTGEESPLAADSNLTGRLK